MGRFGRGNPKIHLVLRYQVQIGTIDRSIGAHCEDHCGVAAYYVAQIGPMVERGSVYCFITVFGQGPSCSVAATLETFPLHFLPSQLFHSVRATLRHLT